MGGRCVGSGRGLAVAEAEVVVSPRFDGAGRAVPSGGGVSAGGSGGETVSPAVLTLPSSLQTASNNVSVSLRVAGAQVGRHGSVTLHFSPLTAGVTINRGSAYLPYYVPTWLERYWLPLLIGVILAILIIMVATALFKEYITRAWDNWRRGLPWREKGQQV
ncbi:MAG: hypothetical protein NVS2B16_35950 [Chloroflexota bacterium]